MPHSSFDFELGLRIVFGRGTLSKVPDVLRGLSATKIMVVTDPGIARSGTLDKVCAVLSDGGFDIIVYDQLEPSPTVGEIDRGAQMLVREACDLVLGVGGGSSLDAAKGISIVATNGGSIADYFGNDKVSIAPIPTVAMPTTAGTGSEVSTGVSVRVEATQSKDAVRSKAVLPRVAILDAELLRTLPKRVAAESSMDALTHLVESYVSRGATLLTDMMSLHGIRLAGEHMGAFVEDRSNTEAAENMLFASLLGGIVISHARTGAAHTVTRPLGHRVAHGLSCAIVLPAVMQFNLTANVSKFADIAAALGEPVSGADPESAQHAVEAVRHLMARVGIESRLSDFGVDETELPTLAKTALALEHAQLNPRVLDEEAIEGILRASL